jgi:outer membrane protein assembly factor BamB
MAFQHSPSLSPCLLVSPSPLLPFSLSPLLVLLFFLPTAASAADPWPTYRGNPQRTGNTDARPGPANAKVLWVLPSEEHFIASPVAIEDRLYVSTLGALNVSTFMCLALDPKAEKDRKLWSKTTPYLKLPTVSSPAVVDGKLIFGDGMHQNNGGILHCVDAVKGTLIWQLPLPGELIHIEGCPTVVDGKVYIGAGNAGVLCLDINRVTRDGKELSVKEMQIILDKKWKELLARYEEDKKKDPDLARKPDEDDLPKPAPVILWQKGQDKWHVDAPVTVVDGKVLVCSAYLEDEKLGDRALYCLDAKSGDERWRTTLTLNPWGGASVQGNTIVVGGSSIRYDPKLLKGAKGDVVAFNLADGKEIWHKEIRDARGNTGGVISSVALTSEAAVAAATDGKIRAFALKDGEKLPVYDGKVPFFASPAVVGDTVYAADLKGVVHAIDLANMQAKWTLDLGTDEKVKAPGMCYAGPIVHGGRIYIGTCNLEGPNARKPTALVCIGE